MQVGELEGLCSLRRKAGLAVPLRYFAFDGDTRARHHHSLAFFKGPREDYDFNRVREISEFEESHLFSVLRLIDASAFYESGNDGLNTAKMFFRVFDALFFIFEFVFMF